jgi:hypothetical protein
MRVGSFLLLGIYLVIIILQSCETVPSTSSSTVEKASNTVTKPTVELALLDPHNHIVDVNESQPDLQNFEDFKVVAVSIEPDLERENVAVNQEKTFQAFSNCDDTACRIFFESLSTGQTYEIQGLPLPHRPFSDVVWVAENILVFDRWSQPHYGIHYAVDVSEQKLLLASPFPDELPQK